MAIVQNPITGRTRKKFGTAVFSKQFDQNTMRTKPLEVKNPRTEAQVIQREKFATVVELMRQVIKTINDAYDGKVRGMSPFNKVTSLTLKEAFDPITNVLDYSKVVFCDNEGSLDPHRLDARSRTYHKDRQTSRQQKWPHAVP